MKMIAAFLLVIFSLGAFAQQEEITKEVRLEKGSNVWNIWISAPDTKAVAWPKFKAKVSKLNSFPNREAAFRRLQPRNMMVPSIITVDLPPLTGLTNDPKDTAIAEKNPQDTESKPAVNEPAMSSEEISTIRKLNESLTTQTQLLSKQKEELAQKAATNQIAAIVFLVGFFALLLFLIFIFVTGKTAMDWRRPNEIKSAEQLRRELEKAQQALLKAQQDMEEHTKEWLEQIKDSEAMARDTLTSKIAVEDNLKEAKKRIKELTENLEEYQTLPLPILMK